MTDQTTPSTRTIGVGLISVGWMGRLHSRAYRAVPDHFPELGIKTRLVVAADPMGGETNRVHIVSKSGVDSWERLPKQAVARKLMEKIADELDARVPLQSD